MQIVIALLYPNPRGATGYAKAMMQRQDNLAAVLKVNLVDSQGITQCSG